MTYDHIRSCDELTFPNRNDGFMAPYQPRRSLNMTFIPPKVSNHVYQLPEYSPEPPPPPYSEEPPKTVTIHVTNFQDVISCPLSTYAGVYIDYKVQYSDTDPDVYRSWCLQRQLGGTTSLYHPPSKTLVHLESDDAPLIFCRIRERYRYEDKKRVWVALYRKCDEGDMSFWNRINWGLNLLFNPWARPLIFIEDIERGRYNSSLLRCTWSFFRDRFS